MSLLRITYIHNHSILWFTNILRHHKYFGAFQLYLNFSCMNKYAIKRSLWHMCKTPHDKTLRGMSTLQHAMIKIYIQMCTYYLLANHRRNSLLDKYIPRTKTIQSLKLLKGQQYKFFARHFGIHHSGASLNIKMTPYQYRYSHYKDKTTVVSSNGNFHYKDKTVSRCLISKIGFLYLESRSLY